MAAEDKICGRVLAMRDKGIVAEERVEQEQQVLLNFQRTLSAARDLETGVAQKLANAEGGRFADIALWVAKP